MHTAIQLYSLRSLDEPLTRTLECIADTDLDGVEFAGVGDDSPTELRETLDSLGLEVAGVHVPIEADLSEQASMCETLGADTFVVPYLDAAHFAGGGAVEETATLLSDIGESLAASHPSLRLCYHNHEHEFVTVDDGKSAFECLVEWTDDIAFELDVGWAYAAGYDPVTLLDSYADRISHVHLKDVALDTSAERGGRPVGLGKGDVPLDACVEAAHAADVEWLVFEHDAPTDPLAFLQRAGAWDVSQ